MDVSHNQERTLTIGIAVWQAEKSNVDTGEAGETNSTHCILQRHDVRPDAVEATRLVVLHRADAAVLDELKVFKLIFQALSVDVRHKLGSKAQN